MSPWPPRKEAYEVTRCVLLRALGFIYFVAFLSLATQVIPLFGEHGIEPVASYLHRLGERLPSLGDRLAAVPTIFWLGHADTLLLVLSWTGVALAAVVMIGFANLPLMLALWALYQSFVQVGQTFYGFGWEMLLLEAGFLALFMVPPLDPRPFPKMPAPPAVIWLFRWLTWRIYLGAGLIKLRGDPCWRDFTCLRYHYETQPLPNPLSWLLYQAPSWVHTAGVAWNHVTELIVPFLLFGPRRLRLIAGCLLILFQVMLILSGNLSFLNYLTIAIALSAFDDRFFKRVAAPLPLKPMSRRQLAVVTLLTAGILVKSIAPTVNLFSDHQVMNGDYDSLHLVNTYGAFGSVGKERNEVIIEGTMAADPTAKGAEWREYEFPFKPGNPLRRPPVVAPYQPRLDWQIWFAAMSDYASEPWLVHLVKKLLTADPEALKLVHSPFGDQPPKWIRAELYRYHFTTFGEAGWWRRERLAEYLPPLSLDNPSLAEFLAAYGWRD